MRKLRSVIAVVGGVAAAALVWRALSRSRSIPCPAWLGFRAGSSVVDRVTRTGETLDRLDLRPGQRVLEVGPGAGRLAVPAARRLLPGGMLAALDIQPAMLERLARNGVSNLAPVLGDAAQPHFRPATFDTVYMCTVLGEIPDRAAALAECFAALKPGGVLSVTEILPDPHYQSRGTVRRLAEAAGFRLRALHGTWLFFTASFSKPE